MAQPERPFEVAARDPGRLDGAGENLPYLSQIFVDYRLPPARGASLRRICAPVPRYPHIPGQWTIIRDIQAYSGTPRQIRGHRTMKRGLATRIGDNGPYLGTAHRHPGRRTLFRDTERLLLGDRVAFRRGSKLAAAGGFE